MITSTTLSAMAGELQKMAAKKKRKDPNAGSGELTSAKNWAGGGLAANIGGGAVMQHMANRSWEHPEDSLLAGKLREQSSIPVHDDLLTPGSAYFADKDWIPGKDKHINIGSAMKASPAVLAHEMGHHQISENRFGRALQNPATIRLGSSAPLIGMLSGAASGLSDSKMLQRLGIAAPALAAAPQLLYEGGASALGLRRMHQTGASREQLLRAAGTLLPAWGTYAGNAALGVGAAYGAQGAVKSMRQSEATEE